jgi:hypothetical protein
MKILIVTFCILIFVGIIYAIFSHSSSSSNSNSNSNTKITCGQNEEYVGNACQCKSLFVRDLTGNCITPIPTPKPAPNPGPVPIPTPSCEDIFQINASGVCTEWELIQTYNASSVLGGISDKGLVVYTPDGIKLNDNYVYKEAPMNISLMSSLNIGVDSKTGIIYTCINGAWIKDNQLKTNEIMKVTENSTTFFALSSDGTIYTKQKDAKSSWAKNGGKAPINNTLLNVNDNYIVAWGTSVYLSSDFGKSWNNVSGVLSSNTVYYCYLTSDTLLIATDSGVYKTNLPNINFSQILNFPVGSDYRTSCINQYNDEIVVVSQDSLDTNMMSLYIFYSPNNGTDFIKLNVVTENNYQLWCPFNVYVYNGVIYVISIGIKTSATDFINQNKSFLYKFNVK